MYAVEPWWPDDIDRLQELTGGVPLRVHELASEWARERAIRDVAAAADRSAAAQSGSPGCGRRSPRASRASSTCSNSGAPTWRPTHAAARRRRRTGAAGCPYKGLAAFEPTDAAMFFGRERLVAELIARLAGAQLLAVVGPSGSGKSSVVRAGLRAGAGEPACSRSPVAGDRRSRRRADHGGAIGTGRATDASRRSPAAVRRSVRGAVHGMGFDRDAQLEYVDRVVCRGRRPGPLVVVVVRADHLERVHRLRRAGRVDRTATTCWSGR